MQKNDDPWLMVAAAGLCLGFLVLSIMLCGGGAG